MWNPEQYLKFAQPGFRPALNLLARIVFDSPWTVYGLGCGTGNVTRMLAQRWPKAKIIGIDDSGEMLAWRCAKKSVPFFRGRLAAVKMRKEIVVCPGFRAQHLRRVRRIVHTILKTTINFGFRSMKNSGLFRIFPFF
jgi:trans-aconitate methyltransferase